MLKNNIIDVGTALNFQIKGNCIRKFHIDRCGENFDAAFDLGQVRCALLE
ncbi:hypothetical protein ES703_93038 [subsurface metagenome]